MASIAYFLLALFLVIEGFNRMGFRFGGDEMVKGLLLVIAGAFLLVEYF